MKEQRWIDDNGGFDEQGRPTDKLTALLWQRRYRGGNGEWVYVATEFTEKARVGVLGVILIYLIGIPLLSFIVGLLSALSLTTLISLALLGARLHQRQERKKLHEQRKRRWIQQRLEGFDAHHAGGDGRGAGMDPLVVGLGGLASASATRDFLSAAGNASAGGMAGGAAAGTKATDVIRGMDMQMRSTGQADRVAASVRDMGVRRQEFQAGLEAEWTAFEAQNLAMNPDLTGSGSDSLLGGLD